MGSNAYSAVFDVEVIFLSLHRLSKPVLVDRQQQHQQQLGCSSVAFPKSRKVLINPCPACVPLRLTEAVFPHEESSMMLFSFAFDFPMQARAHRLQLAILVNGPVATA